MKPLIFALWIFVLIVSTSSYAQAPKGKEKSDKTKINDMDKNKGMEVNQSTNTGTANMENNQQTGDYPYTASYSSNFEIGNPQNAKMVLDLWKDWEDNTLDRHEALFADTVIMILPDGQVIRGKETALSGAKQARGEFTSVKSSVDAFIPLRSKDKNENWVAIWGR